MVHSLNKGKNGEREVAQLLTGIAITAMRELGKPEDEVLRMVGSIQRNQNQSAVGGSDLSNTFGLAIEIKRHETLQVEAWWRQTVEQAQRNSEVPVLLYRQNNKAWRCLTWGYIQIPKGKDEPYSNSLHPTRMEISYTDFHAWFKAWVKGKFLSGYEIRT